MTEQHALAQLFDNNRQWAQDCRDRDPAFFSRLVAQQTPEYLWIGCSDSRVPANEIIGLAPGEVFVHRNVANLVPHTDFNCLSVLQYAVDVLKVKHVLVVGHYGCGGVRAALEGEDKGLIDNWLRNIKDIIYEHAGELRAIGDLSDQADRLCELSVCRQVQNVASTTIVQNAWLRGQPLDVYGLVYSLTDGLLKDLGCGISGMSELNVGYRIDGQR